MRGLVLALMVLAGCDAPTETIVIVDAGLVVRASLASIRARACGAGLGVVLDTTVNVRAGTPDASPVPMRIPLYPQDDDAGRTFALLVEGTDDAGRTVIAARIIGGFEHGKHLELALALDDACMDHTGCNMEQTCHGGSCEPAAVAPFEGVGAPCELTPIDTDLLVNPGFEQDLTSWWQSPDSSGNRIVTTTVHGGAKALEVASSPAGDRNVGQHVSVIAASPYRVSGWISTNGVAGGARIYVSWQDAAGAWFQNDVAGAAVTGTSGWIERTATLTAPTGAVGAALGVGTHAEVDSAGTAWFDDLVFRRE